MRKSDVFPSKYLTIADLDGQPAVLEIARAPLETLGNGDRQKSKIVLYFKNAGKALPLNMTNYDSVADCAGSDETNDWPNTRIEVYPDTCTLADGKIVGCVRIRKPQELALAAEPNGAQPPAGKAKLAPLAKSPPHATMDDEIPF
jgi:hypothetical protein